MSEKSLAEERKHRIEELVQERRTVTVEELCADLQVSPATVRRDLNDLADTGRIRRVRGGAARARGRLEEPLFDEEANDQAVEKLAIASAAYARIQAGETIYLDGGSTVLALARLLHNGPDITVVTNSLPAALELGGTGPDLILIGGGLRRRSQTLVGPLTRHILETLHFDRAFMGTIGVDVAHGLTTTDPEEAYTKELVMGQADEVVLLADHSKEGEISFSRSGGLERLDVLITDSETNKDFVREARERLVDVVLV